MTADNYNTETGSAVIEIAAKELTGIIWGSTEFTYDGKDHVPEATAEGLEGSDVCNLMVTGGQKHAGSGYTAT